MCLERDDGVIVEDMLENSLIEISHGLSDRRVDRPVRAKSA